ncbi:hypothetical protein [Microvirga calopogonii]|uniref:hypothetical protein n=1 Tax=Microvirga calopogonii TaxID=2078013 RepID=UPI00197B2E62|nr:hypothetical protein [Microvirga calopogonii]
MCEIRAKTAILVAASALLCAIPVSIEKSDSLGIRVTADTAQARIGHPATPGSVAGVARRNARRGGYYGYYRPGVAAGALATGAIAAGAGSYYGYGYGNPGTYRYGYPANYGYGYNYPGSYGYRYPANYGYGYNYPANYGYRYPATYGYGYGNSASNPCLHQQRVWTGYNYQWQWVRTC